MAMNRIQFQAGLSLPAFLRQHGTEDAYLGGERNGGKPGRGSENQRPFVIAVDTTAAWHSLHTVIEPVSGFTRGALACCFAALTELGHAQTLMVTEGGRAACEVEGARPLWLQAERFGGCGANPASST